MVSVKEFFAQKKLPRWMTSHSLFKEVTTITKVFPGIGLPNCTKDYAVNNEAAISAYAIAVIKDIGMTMAARKAKLEIRLKQKISKDTIAKVESISKLLSSVSGLINADPKSFLVKNANGTITINIPQDIVINGAKPTFRKGERLFRVYFKLNEMLTKTKSAVMRNVENMQSFKQFSAHNLPPKPLKIVFSSDGVDGLWDIATMSMRGVSSCQSWGGQYHKCLIGSVLDPFVGIIYYTSGKDSDTDYGSKMIRRCIVRFAIDEATKEKHVVLDNMYPGYDKTIAEAFIGFIKEQTNGKVKVSLLQEGETGLNKLYMPLTKLRAKISNGKTREEQFEGIASYQDNFIQSKKSVGKDPKRILFEKNSAKKLKRFTKLFNKTFVEAIDKFDMEQALPDIKPSIQKFIRPVKEEDVIEDTFKYNHNVTMKAIADVLAKESINTVDKTMFDNSDTYIRRVYYAYLLRKKEIFNAVKTKLVKQVNGQLGLKKNKVNAKDVSIFLVELSKTIDIALKEKLKVLAVKRKENFSGPMPLP